MGYGIKILLKQRYNYNMLLDRVCDIDDKLFRLSGFTINFISSCKKLFRISVPDDDENGEFWDNLYNWKYKYSNMDWEELCPIVEQLINSSIIFGIDDDNEKKKCLECIKILHSITDIATTFEIS